MADRSAAGRSHLRCGGTVIVGGTGTQHSNYGIRAAKSTERAPD